jgi:hypothetical protein
LIKLEDSAENKQSPEKCPYKSVTTKVNKIKKKKAKNLKKKTTEKIQ